MAGKVIQRVSLRNFMAFERFRLDLRGDTFLAGPNNAGKSTLIRATRASAAMLRIAFRRNPTDTFNDGRDQVLGYPFTGAQVDLDAPNLPHEFREVETRMSVRFQGGAVLTAVWPPDGSDSFFYLQTGRASVNNVRQARDAFPSIGTVPVLSPVDSEEELLTPKYVRENLDGRLATRHFRNQLFLIRDDRDQTTRVCAADTPLTSRKNSSWIPGSCPDPQLRKLGAEGARRSP